MPIPSYTYHLQEQAFFNWFFGSIDGGGVFGLNGWYSNDGSFLTDAGPICS